jgi:hypothetical protein
MSGILIAILVISAAWFVVSYVAAIFGEDGNRVSVACGTILTLILWQQVFVLGLIVLIFTGIGLLINALKIWG